MYLREVPCAVHGTYPTGHAADVRQSAFQSKADEPINTGPRLVIGRHEFPGLDECVLTVIIVRIDDGEGAIK